jgi:hypothetical protein
MSNELAVLDAGPPRDGVQATRIRVQEARARVRASLVHLRAEVRAEVSSLDWRESVRRRPALCAGFAFGIGLLFGLRR